MATRFYLPSTGAAAVSPAYSGSWDDTTHAGSRLKCVVDKISSSMTNVDISGDGDNTDKDYLIQQWVSDPIAEQTISAQTVKLQIRAFEDSSSNNQYIALTVRVCVNDGSSYRGTILALSRDDTELTPSLLTNRSFSATSSAVDAEEGDRIVIEIGFGGDPGPPASHDGDLSIGDDSGTDLPEDDSESSAYNPWFEFASDISFPSAGVTVTPAAITAVAASTGPSAVILGSITVTPSPGTGVVSSVNPTVIHGSITVTPSPGTGVVTSVGPSDIIHGSITVTPTPGTGVVVSVAPTVVLGSTTVTPAAATAVCGGNDPTVIEGGGGPVTVTPDPVTCVAASVAPTVILGSIVIAPAAVSTIAERAGPSVILGSITITPTAITMVGARINPGVVLGSITVTPSAGTGVTSTYDPTVILGSLIVAVVASVAICGRNNPTVLYGSTTASPDPAWCVTARRNPTVIDGGGAEEGRRWDIWVVIMAFKHLFRGVK